jgi:hypothetical protein
MIPAFDCMPAFGGFVKLHGIYPNDRSRHHTKIEVVDHCLGISALGLSASDLLFEFLETGLDFPSGTIILHDLLDREGQIRAEQGDPSGFAKDPDHTHRTLESLESDHPVKGHDLTDSTVEIDIV